MDNNIKQDHYNVLVKQAEDLKGTIRAPASKSYTTRAIIISGLAKRAVIYNPLYCDDTRAAIKTWEDLGAEIKTEPKRIIIKGLNRRLAFKKHTINAGESGTLLRLMLSVLALAKGKYTVTGKGTLLERPNANICNALESLGVKVKGRGRDYKLPITIESNGEIDGGRVEVSAGISSQVISSLLNIAAFAKYDTQIIVKDRLVSRPYVDITIDILGQAGIKVKADKTKGVFFIKAGQRPKDDMKFNLHGDYSSSAFLMAAACLTKSDVAITDLIRDKQGDAQILNILKRMGAKINRASTGVRIKGPFELNGIEIDCSDTPDLVPILCVLGCFAKGKTVIKNIGHLVFKESNRIQAPKQELQKLGACLQIARGSLIIKESRLKPGIVYSHNDHRIAMSLIVAGLKIGGLTIERAECINKSYPRFIQDIKKIGADVIISGTKI